MLSDAELIQGFESATLPSFPHADHVRVTILYLALHGREETERKLFEGLRRFAAAKGVPEKFHVTMTIAWLDLVEDARRCHPEASNPAALVAACPELLNRDALLRFYTAGRLLSDDARQRWVPPDLTPGIRLAHESKASAATLPEIERI
jgi:hypothetical protein